MIDHSRKDETGRDGNRNAAWQKRAEKVFHEELILAYCEEDKSESALREAIAGAIKSEVNLGIGLNYVEIGLAEVLNGNARIGADQDKEPLERIYGKRTVAKWSELKIQTMYAKKFAHAFAKVAKAIEDETK